MVYALAIAASCSSGGELGGIWRGMAPIGSDSLVRGNDGTAIAVEVIIGEFGPDIAGVIRFFRAQAFLRARNADAPDRECACVYLHSGKVDTAAAHAWFSIEGCLPGGSTRQPLLVRGELVRTPMGAQLKLKVNHPGSPLNQRETNIDLEQFGGAGDIADADLQCPLPLPTGNTSSGL